ncbi:MAG: hypothetical protein ACRBBN_21285 [Methyloligellaceae bacterium]
MLLPRIFLVLMQVGAALFLGDQIRSVIKFIPRGPFEYFVIGVIFALLVWLVGHVGGVVLKDVKPPSPATLSYALIGALIGAALITFLPGITGFIKTYASVRIAPVYFPLAGAIIGYFVQK